MAKILTLLLLNKSGYEVGRFTSLGKLYDDSNQLLFRNLISTKDDFESESNDIKKWVEYFLSFVEKSYEELIKMDGIGEKTAGKIQDILREFVEFDEEEYDEDDDEEKTPTE